MKKEYNPIEIGERVAARRRELGLTQEQLAERMGVSVQMISNLERCEKVIRANNLLLLSRELGVSCDYILKGNSTVEDFADVVSDLQELGKEDLETVKYLIYKLKRRRG